MSPAAVDGDGAPARTRRLAAEGATLVPEHSDPSSWWIVLTDPEGDEFCPQ